MRAAPNLLCTMMRVFVVNAIYWLLFNGSNMRKLLCQKEKKSLRQCNAVPSYKVEWNTVIFFSKISFLTYVEILSSIAVIIWNEIEITPRICNLCILHHGDIWMACWSTHILPTTMPTRTWYIKEFAHLHYLLGFFVKALSYLWSGVMSCVIVLSHAKLCTVVIAFTA